MQAQLDKFKSSWELSTGTSMELLWSRFRPPTARNRSELTLLLRVENLSDRLDSVAWRSKVSLEMLLDLRRSILRLHFVDQPPESLGEDTFTV